MFRGQVGFLIFHGKHSHQCGTDEKEGPATWELTWNLGLEALLVPEL